MTILLAVETSDPVSLVEIAERAGVKRDKASWWQFKGLLGDPQWILGNTPVWAWEVVREREIVSKHLGTYQGWQNLKGALPRGVPFKSFVASQDEWLSTRRRIERHLRSDGRMCGYMALPTSSGVRLVFTDDLSESGSELSAAEVERQIDEWVAGSAARFRGGDRRDPLVSRDWLALAGEVG